MAKAKKQTHYKPKKKGKYDITVKPPEGMTFEQLMQRAANTPIKGSKAKKK